MLKLFGKEAQPMSASDKLFAPNNIQRIYISGFKWHTGEIEFRGTVTFTITSQHGNTEGTQEFKGDSIPDVYNKIINFCNNL